MLGHRAQDDGLGAQGVGIGSLVQRADDSLGQLMLQLRQRFLRLDGPPQGDERVLHRFLFARRDRDVEQPAEQDFGLSSIETGPRPSQGVMEDPQQHVHTAGLGTTVIEAVRAQPAQRLAPASAGVVQPSDQLSGLHRTGAQVAGRIFTGLSGPHGRGQLVHRHLKPVGPHVRVKRRRVVDPLLRLPDPIAQLFVSGFAALGDAHHVVEPSLDQREPLATENRERTDPSAELQPQLIAVQPVELFVGQRPAPRGSLRREQRGIGDPALHQGQCLTELDQRRLAAVTDLRLTVEHGVDLASRPSTCVAGFRGLLVQNLPRPDIPQQDLRFADPARHPRRRGWPLPALGTDESGALTAQGVRTLADLRIRTGRQLRPQLFAYRQASGEPERAAGREQGMNDTAQSQAGATGPRRYTGQVTAGPGGAMTDEVGVITGDLTLTTSIEDDGLAHSRIQYTDADEWYTLTGSPQPLSGTGLQALHELTLNAVCSGGGGPRRPPTAPHPRIDRCGGSPLSAPRAPNPRGRA
ncbi:hypothetical protein, partial [Streptomyces sp. NPDC056670]|uniref:hypothetical protein n=1 Tax=Streptomyces sp. NPDC056670 TaxID=3345904 RepID=UPI0036C86CD8